MNRIIIGLVAFVFVVPAEADKVYADAGLSAANAFQKLDGVVRALVADGSIVGGQVAVRRDGEMLFSRGYGVVAVGSDREVDEKTLFLIASCSKPFASACVLSVIGDEAVAMALDDEIDRWLPAFGKAKVKGGAPVTRAPTVEELMGHRAGIYSQKAGMTKAQAQWIRDFRYDLKTAVDGISAYSFIAQPGEKYAYSGAGYCVLGRVVERATGQSFEAVLQERICRPLGLSRTTYFPAGKFADDEIATGVGREGAPHRLEEEHRLPLIGGSLYTTADEMTLFGCAVAVDQAENGAVKRLPIKPELIAELGRVRSPESGYSLGWKVLEREGKAVRLSHSGALLAYRAWLAVDLERGISVAGCWTLSDLSKQPSVAAELQEMMDGL